ncbi:MAG TPA: chitobiase/beta-hexosaminidase C-terminal domain-containing protein [Spirochaetota bacterium]|nr:chitobiase/beta-hexosaminidase C-terminal domain-containing protein [Spirochaetota bacterium]HQF09163.1 chitobiase/beta-hexosaminidase C-terminal domain-containing protein [Spirochaetota bacterium]HQJ71408.1 chitobiase/beta-hexosaminidase C-terminal domain-containing protein [Spirochaetota bacterium]
MRKRIMTALVFLSLGFLINCGSKLETGNLEPESLLGINGLFGFNLHLPKMINSIAPANNATGITTTPVIRVFFSVNMNPTSINDTTFILADQNNNSITGTISYDGGTRTATFLPPALANTTTYTITLTTGIMDDTGKRLPYTVTSKFTTVDSATVPAPEFSLMAGSYEYSMSPGLTIQCSDGLATIMYTTDGTTPTQTNGAVYSAGFTITANTTVRAMAFRAGMNDSTVTSAQYNITVDAPVFSIGEGTYNVDQNIDLTCATPGAVIHYTTNGTTPTLSSPVYSGIPIHVWGNNTTRTIRAMAALSGLSNSTVVSNSYTIDYLQVATPTIDIPAGYYNTEPLNLHITTGTTGATIHYYVNGTEGWGVFGTSEAFVNIDASMTQPVTVTATAIAIMMEDSGSIAAVYTIDTTAPTCLVTTPADMSEYVSIVPPDPTITITCDENMTVSTFTSDAAHPNACSGTVRVQNVNTGQCAGLVRDTTASSNIIRFHPSVSLDSTTPYQIMIGNTVADLAGNATGFNIFTSFRTDLEGTLDASFNGTGYNSVTTAFSQEGRSVKIQSDNKIIVAGSTNISGNYDAVLWRFGSDGVLDGTAFVLPAYAVGDNRGCGVVLTPMRIIMGGYTLNPLSNYDFALAGYEYNGNLDSSFGISGTGYISQDFLLTNNDYLNAITIDGIGRTVAVGSTIDPFNGTTTNFAIARFQFNGSAVDPSFASPIGMLSFDFNNLHRDDVAQAIAIDPGALPSDTSDDHIIIAGWHNNGVRDFFAVAVFDDAGNNLYRILDPFPGGTSATANAVAVQSDGRILVAGRVIIGGTNRIAVARYNANLAIDTTFGINGYATIAVPGSTNSEAKSMALQSDGKIIIAGTATIPGTANDIVVVRLNRNGTLDTTFARSALDGDTDGIAIFDRLNNNQFGNDVTIQPIDKRIVITGVDNSGTEDVIVIRYK